MLSLEQRYLETLLPSLTGLDVVDLGCGTGRWLHQIAHQKPRSLTGIDSSSEMLAVASRKAPTSQLKHADVCSSGLRDGSADFVLASFLLGYVEDLSAFVHEVRRLLRPGGTVFISDLHPQTALRLGWRRRFKSGSGAIEFAIRAHGVSEIAQCFRENGFELSCLVEPRFGEAERLIFASAGRGDFETVAPFPAIFVAGFTLPTQSRELSCVLHDARVALGPRESPDIDIAIADDRITSIAPAIALTRSATRIDLSGFLILPGLINAHDHLDFGLFPRLGGAAYVNANHWAEDIQQRHRDVIERHRSVPKESRLWWGALRNTLSGVTTVCHHNPYNPVFETVFPVRVIRTYEWAHSFSFDEVLKRHASADPEVPFILHLGEGTDPGATAEFGRLLHSGLLDARTVIVHGVSLSDRDIETLNCAGGSLIWCPSSNRFLFGRTVAAHHLSLVERLALGSDSCLTAAGDFLDEVREAATHIADEDIYEIATTGPAQILQLRNGEGRIIPNGYADFIAVRDRGADPVDILPHLRSSDVELVMCGGRVVVASTEMLDRLLPEQVRSLAPIEVDGVVRWVRAPLGKLFSDATKHLGCDLRLGGKRVRHVSSSWI
jgi:cytosine/adenosine deaminase-related metal-dependent hydrolase/ubiquinone/menaquinone biosynthesis C-methylase UbiE